MKIYITDCRNEKANYYNGQISLENMYNFLLEHSKLTVFGLIGMLPTIRQIHIYIDDKYGSVDIEFLLNDQQLHVKNIYLAQILANNLKDII